eukprot:1152659-Pelagomonas_calceolata.AAC.3
MCCGVHPQKIKGLAAAKDRLLPSLKKLETSRFDGSVVFFIKAGFHVAKGFGGELFNSAGCDTGKDSNLIFHEESSGWMAVKWGQHGGKEQRMLAC